MTQQTTSLPTLTGSEKQIAWASQIREKALATVAAWQAEGEARTGKRLADHPDHPATKAVAKLPTITSAKWWIDNGQGRVDAEHWVMTAGRTK